MVKRVLRGQLHAALGIRPVEDEELWVQAVGGEGFSVCIPREHRLAHRSEITVKDLDREPVFWVPPSLHPRFYARVMKYLHSVGVGPVFREVRAQAHALELASQGFGMALLPRSAARVSRTGVIIKTLADKYLGIETVLFMRRDQRHGALKEVADDLLLRLRGLKIEIS